MKALPRRQSGEELMVRKSLRHPYFRRIPQRPSSACRQQDQCLRLRLTTVFQVGVFQVHAGRAVDGWAGNLPLRLSQFALGVAALWRG